MARVLVAWIGQKDLDAASGDPKAGLGPVAKALAGRDFDHGVLLNTWSPEKAKVYEAWLRKQTKTSIALRQYDLSSPTNHADVYRAAMDAVAWAKEKYGAKSVLTFHLSPGTPAMAAIWIIIAKTQVDAELVETQPKSDRVFSVDVPFALSAEFIPRAVQQTNEDLARLGDGARPEEASFGDILHKSEVMKRLVRRARQAAPFDETILIEGESGTGKQLLAVAIHGEGPRKDKPLVEVNCGAIPRELFESQLFGHAKGAFTGAAGDYKGFFEQAQGGTLFLDEVGELTLDHQVKLLKALQEKKIRPVGGRVDIRVDVRVIAATNRRLLEEVRAGRFREDLYYRLAVLSLKLPPLRDRQGDVSFLIDKLCAKLNKELGARSGYVEKKLSAAGRNLLLRHGWPGNVRELEGTLRRAFIWSPGPTIDETQLRDALFDAPSAATEVLGRSLGNGFNLDELLTDVSRHYLARAIKEANGNKTAAATLLGFASPQRLKLWLEKYEVVE